MDADLAPTTCTLLTDLLTPSSSPTIPSSSGPLSLSAQHSPQLSHPPPLPPSTPSQSESDSDSEQKEAADLQLTQEQLEAATVNSDDEQFEDASSSPEIEEDSSSIWRGKSKHIFVLSEAGKPIYSLHGEESHLVSLGGIMQALVSFVADNGDSIRSIRTGDSTIVFLVKSPLILVGVSTAGQSSSQLTVQLSYIHSQIISVLTLAQLNRIFDQRRNYDLRRMLSGSERLMTALSSSMDTDPSYFLSAVRCLPLPSSTRDLVSETIIRFAGKVSDVVFGILIADNQLVTLVRMKKYFIHPADLHLIFNLINSTESFKHSESWTPLCLPKFDSSGFLHAHVSYLSDNNPACLLLITTDRNAFFSLSGARAKVVERLERHGVINTIKTSVENASYTTSSIDLAEVRHFLYKSRTSAQFTSPLYSPCYKTEHDRRRLDSLYLSMQNRFHSVSLPLKLAHYSTQNETVLGWLTQAFELYAVFSPTTTKLGVITAVNKLLRWVKKEEEKMFILTAPTF